MGDFPHILSREWRGRLPLAVRHRPQPTGALGLGAYGPGGGPSSHARQVGRDIRGVSRQILIVFHRCSMLFRGLFGCFTGVVEDFQGSRGFLAGSSRVFRKLVSDSRRGPEGIHLRSRGHLVSQRREAFWVARNEPEAPSAAENWRFERGLEPNRAAIQRRQPYGGEVAAHTSIFRRSA